MKILAIETSCDDTCVSIVKIKNPLRKASCFLRSRQKLKIKNFEILSNIVSSQVKLHAKYGGVYPFMAKREHQRNLPIVFKKALKKAKNPKINLIAVTVGPGLEPCLWVGVNFAKELSQSLSLPLVPINHIEAHILANWLLPIGNTKNLFPAICLVVSGGHTQLILMRDFGKYKILGETRDDAAGECFDKTARILGLGYPGGPAIAASAAKLRSTKYEEKKSSNLQTSDFRLQLPRPMIYQKNYDFSFSGLKTAVLYLVKQLVETGKKLTINQKREISAEIQQAIIDVLIHKTLKAAKDYKTKTIILGGGVAANQELRRQFKQKIKKEMANTKYLIPNTKYCTDNAAMVAVAGYFNHMENKKIKLKNIKADANLRLSFEN